MYLRVPSWIRAAGKRAGLRLPFTSVVCASGTKTITLDADGRVRIGITRTLVFLEPPDPEALCDTYSVSPGEQLEALTWGSSDALELSRVWRQKPPRVTVHWRPKEPITPYALYVHHNDWVPSASADSPALCLDYRCDMRTGVFVLELAGTTPFETVVAFRRPRWPRLSTDRQVVRHALDCLRAQANLARLAQDGTRAEVEIRNPQVGDRYLMVAFRRFGVVDMEEWLRQTSLMGRLRRRVGGWTTAVTSG
jgi:hypothetical protein